MLSKVDGNVLSLPLDDSWEKFPLFILTFESRSAAPLAADYFWRFTDM